VALLIALVTTSCAQADDGANSIIRVHRSDPGGGMDAIVAGIVEIDLEAGCVWLAHPSGNRQPAVWPHGTVERLDPFEIVLLDGEVVRAGDEVRGGGGYVDANPGWATWDPFPDECVHTGSAAVFNAGSEITVTPGVGLELADTLVARFSPPQSLGLELVAVNPNDRSVAVVDFVGGTVHLYDHDQYVSPADAIDGASGGGGFIHLWAEGVIYSYPGPIDSEPLVFEPEPLRKIDGYAPVLTVLPAPDGEHTWLVQPGIEGDPTLVEFVNLVEVQLARLGSFEIAGDWSPVGSTALGLVMNGEDPDPRSILVDPNGEILAELAGTALSVGNTAAIRRTDGSLVITDADLGNAREVQKPGPGSWEAVGGPTIPSDAPPVVTGGSGFLVALVADAARGINDGGQLVFVDSAGNAEAIHTLSGGQPIASWSRDWGWVVVVEDKEVTLVPIDGQPAIPLGALIPTGHWVVAIG
jgi:hypothetical protein